jgi:alanyl-tRNA synthetase
MQFDRDEKGALNPLPKPSIDTGMGLERITAAMQGVKSNYDTDFFTGLIEKIEKIAGIGYGRDETVDSAMRVIADHGRATAFLIADGVLPSNEGRGRGYVLRRIMRRALRHGKKLGFEKPFLHAVAAQVVEEMGGQYPELPSNREFIRKVVVNEEDRFLATLDSGLKILFHGKVAFKLYDTYGFPLDLTQDMCRERGLEVDTAEFDTEMEKQKEMARQAWKGGDYVSEISTYTDLLEQGFKTEFTGYDFTSDTGAVVRIVRQREKVERAESGDDIDLVTNRTPFYAESGGQIGDRGNVWSKEGAVEIEESFFVAENIIVHRGKVVSGSIAVGDRVTLAIEEELRRRTQANHTATHILQAALRDILGDHVRQAGSYVGPDKLRFDYTHFDQVSPEQKREIEEFVNRVIHQRRDVTWELLSYDLALANGAMAFFGEKYGDIVRMVKVDGVSAELCGGTHATNTGDLGVFVLTEERALASGVRRMESLTGMEAFTYLNDLRRTLEKTSHLLAVAPEDVDARVEKLLSDMKRLEKEKEEIRKKAMKGNLLGGELKVEEYSGVPFAHRFVEEVEVKILREMMDELKGKLKKGVARKIVDEISRVTGGSGGGRADLAQTGSTDPRLLETAVGTTKDYLKNL